MFLLIFRRISVITAGIFLLTLTPGCVSRTFPMLKATVAFETRLYTVVQMGPDTFVVLTRSKGVIDEINSRLGCGDVHVCAGGWSGELWTIERLGKK